jgi:hypothetical protein
MALVIGDIVTNTTLLLLQAKHLVRGLTPVRVLMHAAVLFVVAIFPCTSSTQGSRTVTESEAPVDQDETSQERDISLQDGTRVRCKQLSVALPVPNRIGLLVSVRTAGASRSGHCLPNGLLAPLRC